VRARAARLVAMMPCTRPHSTGRLPFGRWESTDKAHPSALVERRLQLSRLPNEADPVARTVRCRTTYFGPRYATYSGGTEAALPRVALSELPAFARAVTADEGEAIA
jgi:hypothetical protein